MKLLCYWKFRYHLRKILSNKQLTLWLHEFFFWKVLTVIVNELRLFKGHGIIPSLTLYDKSEVERILNIFSYDAVSVLHSDLSPQQKELTITDGLP